MINVLKYIHQQRLENLSAVLDKFSPGSDASITFPATARLLALVAILPLSSASAERLFSKMRLVGTRLRGLDEANLAQILFLGVEAPWDDGGIPVQAASEYVEAKSTKSDERKLPYVQLATLMDCIRVCTQWRRDLTPKNRGPRHTWVPHCCGQHRIGGTKR